ncbi:hypothetical protein FNV43_RR20238 [Rhamnella rubrinervis]|uniref:Uncharacterized protein n=1 Tax=Rhamnella rubrinervis TaxID=2594499 RepID=A0A8K0GWW0_9ROSA|nr:hypothetical protein FNV43_RR20238 [Rhamnella rubrinervis]
MAWRTGHHAGPYSLIFTFKIGEEGAGWRSSMPYRRPSLSNLHIGTQDGMEDRPSCRTAGWPALHAILAGLPHPIFIYGMEDRLSCSPYSLNFTFKIGEEDSQNGCPPAIPQAFLIQSFHIKSD